MPSDFYGQLIVAKDVLRAKIIYGNEMLFCFCSKTCVKNRDRRQGHFPGISVGYWIDVFLYDA